MTKTYCDGELTDVVKTQQAGRDKFHINTMCVEGVEWWVASCFWVFHCLGVYVCACVFVTKGMIAVSGMDRKTSDVHNKVGTRGNSAFLQDKN